MRIDDRASEAVHQFEASKCHLNKVWPAKNHGDEMLRRLLRCSRNGTSPEDLTFVTFVIFQNGIRLRRQCLTIMSVWIDIDRDHVRPVLEVLLAFGREFMLMIHRPTVEITYAIE